MEKLEVGVRPMKVLGRPLPRIDARRKLRAETYFAYDLFARAKSLPGGLLFMKIVRSSIPHGIIESIDTSEAEDVPGVVAIFTHEDVPKIKFTTAGQSYPEASPYDMLILDKKVRFVGQPVALVVAESQEAAEEAAAKVRVKYQMLPAVFDPEEALKPDAPKIHDGGNLIGEIKVDVGDVEAALKESEVVIEREYKTQIIKHCHLEPYACLAYIDENGNLVIETANQVIYHTRRIIARALGIPIGKVKVVQTDIGGGFGDRQEVGCEHYAAFAAWKLGRPVFLALSRTEQFYLSRRKHAGKFKIRMGATRDGIIKAIEMRVIEDAGAYGTHAMTVMANMGSMTLPLYTKHCKNLRFYAKAVYTNKVPGGAFRGYGTVQGGFALEMAVNELAEVLGMDPVELRLKNLVEEGDKDPIFEHLSERGKGIPRIFHSCKAKEALLRGAELFGWGRKKPEQEGPIKRGYGLAMGMKGSGVALYELGAAFLKMNEDGTVDVFQSAADMGQGAFNTLAAIAAEAIGIPVDWVHVVRPDTSVTPFDYGTYASSTTYVTGNAVLKAAKMLKEKVLKRAAKMMGRDPNDLEIEDGKVFVKENPSESVDVRDVAMDAYYGSLPREVLVGYGFAEDYISPPPFTAHFAEVEVDEELGTVRVVRYVAVTDSGKIINPKAAEGQVIGAVGFGIGYALLEEVKYNEKGYILNPNFRKYLIPSAHEIPDVIVDFVESDEPTGPFGAKSIAEVAFVPVAPAIASAVRDAIGVWIRELPITPEKVLKALGKL